MPRQILDGLSFPHTIAGPGALRRWYVTGGLIQGTGDGVVNVYDGTGGTPDTRLVSVTTAASGGGAAFGPFAVDPGTSADNDQLILTTTGTPGTVTGYVDYSWR